MEQSKKTIGKYVLDKLLGKGQFGGVFLGLDTEDDNRPYAIKVIDKKSKLQPTSKAPLKIRNCSNE